MCQILLKQLRTQQNEQLGAQKAEECARFTFVAIFSASKCSTWDPNGTFYSPVFNDSLFFHNSNAYYYQE
ncbi:Hypothetical protein NTJ_15578 [Nesidiocoris tenuis]|uniref:Uncharacterized protein n=1 Tax=Nesidiocoris tenuis TaxID=355587 RepID=A0ABN7BEF9_9HEMI|nr:Hypothetical protein NTJ_15578 [Nesidiocoris tenuis]